MSYSQSGGYNLGIGYIDPSDQSAKHIKQRKDQFYQSNYVGNSQLWIQGAIDKRFKVGDQIFYQQQNGNNQAIFQKIVLNLIRRHINMVGGFQRKNRKTPITIPLHDQDDPLADDYNTVLRWCDDRDGYQEYQSQAFEGALDTGETLLHLYPDYSLDPISGDLFTDQVAYNNYLIDQYYRKQDLSDCNGIWRRRWVTNNGLRLLLPGYEEEIKRMRPTGTKDGRFPFQAELNNLSLTNLYTYDEFYYRDTRLANVILDPYTGEAVEWDQEETDDEGMMEQALAQQPWLKVHKVQVPTVKLCISIGDKEVYNGANLLNIDEYPFVPVSCYHEPDMQNYAWRKMGMVRNLRDAQFLYNMRTQIELSILQSQINSGWIFPVDAVTDLKCFRQSGEGFLIPLKKGHTKEEIQKIEPYGLPPTLMELSARLAEDITKISGVNEELLGSATDDKSGILSMLRQGAGLTTLQTIFDKLDYSQRLYGKIRLQAIRKNFSKGKVRNILGHDADPRFWTSHSQKYSIAVEEGNYSTTQRQMELQQLLYFKELGMNIPEKTIMRAAFITNKKQIMKDIEEQNQQQQQQQQQQAALEEKKSNAEIMSQFSKAKLDQAKAAESYAKIEELNSQSAHNMTKADLETVKAMIELEDMDLNNFKANLELAEYIKMQNKQSALTG